MDAELRVKFEKAVPGGPEVRHLEVVEVQTGIQAADFRSGHACHATVQRRIAGQDCVEVVAVRAGRTHQVSKTGTPVPGFANESLHRAPEPGAIASVPEPDVASA